jgi:hypothetical protein
VIQESFALGDTTGGSYEIHGRRATWVNRDDKIIDLKVGDREFVVNRQGAGPKGNARYYVPGWLQPSGKLLQGRSMTDLIETLVRLDERLIAVETRQIVLESRQLQSEARIARLERKASIEDTGDEVRKRCAERRPELHRFPIPRAMSPEALGLDPARARAAKAGEEKPFLWMSEAVVAVVEDSHLSTSRKANLKLLLLALAQIANDVRASCFECHKAHLIFAASVGRSTLVKTEKDAEALNLVHVVRRKVPGKKENEVNCYLLLTHRAPAQVVQILDDTSSKNQSGGCPGIGQTGTKKKNEDESPARDAGATGGPPAHGPRARTRTLSRAGDETKRRAGTFVVTRDAFPDDALWGTLFAILGEREMRENGTRWAMRFGMHRDTINTLVSDYRSAQKPIHDAGGWFGAGWDKSPAGSRERAARSKL